MRKASRYSEDGDVVALHGRYLAKWLPTVQQERLTSNEQVCIGMIIGCIKQGDNDGIGFWIYTLFRMNERLAKDLAHTLGFWIAIDPRFEDSDEKNIDFDSPVEKAIKNIDDGIRRDFAEYFPKLVQYNLPIKIMLGLVNVYRHRESPVIKKDARIGKEDHKVLSDIMKTEWIHIDDVSRVCIRYQKLLELVFPELGTKQKDLNKK